MLTPLENFQRAAMRNLLADITGLGTNETDDQHIRARIMKHLAEPIVLAERARADASRGTLQVGMAR